MNRKTFTENLIDFLPYIMFFAVSILIGVISFKTYKYYQSVDQYNEKAQIFNGQKEGDKVKNSFAPLVNKLKEARSRFLTQLKDKPSSSLNNDIFSESQGDMKGEWIPYPGGANPPVNYSKLDLVENAKPNNLQSSKENSNQIKSIPKSNPATTPTPAPTPVPDAQNTDNYVFTKLLEDLILKFKENKSDVSPYSKYNEVMWKALFDTDLHNKENRETFSKDYSIGKIYVVSPHRLAIYPKVDNIGPFDFSGRPWWQQKSDRSDNIIIEEFKEDKNNTALLVDDGVTTTYTDIAVKNTQITDLTRTVWLRFKYLGREYLFCADLRLNPPTFNLWDDVKWLLGALLGSLIVLLVSVFLRNKIENPPQNPSRVYQLERIERKKVVNDVGQEAKYKISHTVSVKDSIENINRIEKTGFLRLDAKILEARLGKNTQKVKANAKSETISMTLDKEIDLKLNSNLKAFELWKVYRPNTDGYVLGMIGVMWQNSESNDITTERYFWDSNTTASDEEIELALKKHLRASENETFLFDQSSPLDVEPNVVNKLKEKLPYFADFANKFDSYNNRKLLFDNNALILEKLYTVDTETFATCSIEFLDNLKRQGKIKDILNLPVKIRYIIDGETRKFRNFYENLDDELKEFLTSKNDLMIIEYRPEQKVIYQNRDFCIISFGKDKCVFYTDMSDDKAQKGWISWREVDIEYYQTIRNFIESVERKSVNNYLAQ